MKSKIIGYSIALVLAYGVAYQTWTREDEPEKAESIVLLSAKPDEVESIVYTTEKSELLLRVEKDAFGRYLWGRVAPKPEDAPIPTPSAGETAAKPTAVDETHPPSPDGAEPSELATAPDPASDKGGTASASPPAEEPEEKIVEFKAGAAGDRLLEGVAPFIAKRALSGIDETKLKDLGLDDPSATLTVNRKGKPPKSFELGANVYGGANYYVRDPEAQTVYLVDAALLRPLESAERTLPDTNLVEVTMKDIVSIEVRSGDTTAVFEQHNPDDPKAMFWSAPGTEEAHPGAAAWIEKALRLRSSAYITEEEAQKNLEVSFSFNLRGRDGRQTGVTVYRAFNDSGEVEWFARSEHTRSLVSLHASLAAEATADLASVLSTSEDT